MNPRTRFLTESDIWNLLKQLGTQKFHESVVPFMLNFEPLVSQIFQMITEK